MAPTTDDPKDPRLTHGADAGPTPMANVYLVLSAEERAKGYVRPVRRAYIHDAGISPCGIETRMAQSIAETYARDPNFYGATYCMGCGMHLPVDEFHWIDARDQLVGS